MNIVENGDLNALSTKGKNSILPLVLLAMGFVMATLDVTVINVAGSTMQENLNLSVSNLTWIIDGYTLTYASLLLVGGSLANRYGAKNIYMIGLIIFILASFVSAIAPNGITIIIARLFQGAGAAIFMPSSLSLLVFIYTDEKQRAKMFGIWTAVVSIASASGPFIGGVLVNELGWRSIFLVNLPIGIIGLILTHRIIPKSSYTKSSLNYTTHILGIIALAALSFTIIEGPSYGWSSIYIFSSALVSISFIVLFILKEHKSKEPIIPKELLSNRSYSNSNIVGFLINFALFGGIFVFGLFLQKSLGDSPFIAGVHLLPVMVVFVIGNMFFSRITQYVGVKKPMVIALAVSSIGSLILVSVSHDTPYWFIAIVYALANLGVGVSVPAMTSIIMESSGKTNANIAGATLNASRQIGALVGVAIMGLVINVKTNWYTIENICFLIMAIAYFIAMCLTYFFLKDKKVS